MSAASPPAPPARRVLVSGASGFIGCRVAADLQQQGFAVRRMLREQDGAEDCVCADLADPPSLARACEQMELVVHCAGRAHAFGARPAEDEILQQAVNAAGSLALAQAAAAAGVRHFVFLSSVKAVGHPGRECAAEDWPLPPDSAYGRAKRAAEQSLHALSEQTGMAVTSLRLAMVYGHGSRGNLERMLAGVRAGWFPPLPDTGGRRSLVHVADVVAAIRSVLDEPRAFGRIWNVASAQQPVVSEIQACARVVLGREPARWSVPAVLLRAAGRVGDGLSALSGRPLPLSSEIVRRLLDSECYSAEAIRQELGWEARVSLADGVHEALTGQWLVGRQA